MKIGIDVFGSDHSESGIGSYLFSFINNLPHDDGNEYVLFGNEVDRYTYGKDRGFKYIGLNVKNSIGAERRWHYKKLNSFARKNKFDALLFPCIEAVLPLTFRVKSAVVVQSILSKTLKTASLFQKMQLKKGLKNVHYIIAASNYIKEDLVNLGVDDKKIYVVHNGIDHKTFFQTLDFDSDIVDIKPFAIKRPYFIYGSRLSGPEKKHEELIKAFELFKEKTGLPHRLVIAGSDGEASEKIQKLAFESKYASEIFLTGFFPHETFPMLYKGSDACVFPAVAEGVGLPVLEALACGVPVICSNKGALPEIGGNSPLYFDSDNPSEIEEKMEKVVNDKTFRAQMIAEGLAWSENFSWEKTVENTFKVLCQ